MTICACLYRCRGAQLQVCYLLCHFDKTNNISTFNSSTHKHKTHAHMHAHHAEHSYVTMCACNKC